MQNKINYQLMSNKIIEEIGKRESVPALLLHSCCAPCSSYVIEYLSRYFKISVFYYNPNITNKDEYEKRLCEQKRFIRSFKAENPIDIIEAKYDPDEFFNIAKGLENAKEGGERCFRCYRLRLCETARAAAENKFDYFTTTLSVSPYKNAAKLNEIGKELEEEYGVKYFFSDFKKNNGYVRSIELSREYDLYRQNYCGCIYSKR